jgi:PII-like signaling protein
MTAIVNARRIRIYLDEGDQLGLGPLYLAVLEKLRAEGCSGATAFRGIAGFGAHHRMHAATLLDISGNLPIIVEWIDTPEQVERVLPVITAMIKEGMITSEDVQVVYSQPRVAHR